jgi:tetratricopeptide (TPR) repeat protein
MLRPSGWPLILLLGAVLASGPARADDWQACMTLSFAPLDQNIPACDTLLESGELPDDRRIDALWARAQAFLFALTYHFGHSIDDQDLVRRALADLDQAKALASAQSGSDQRQLAQIMRERASVLYQLGRHREAAEEYTAVFDLLGETDPPSLLARALAYKEMGQFDSAIADMDEVIRVTEGALNQSNWFHLRGEIYEAAGNQEAAVADYRRTLQLQADHGGAAKALDRLGAER